MISASASEISDFEALYEVPPEKKFESTNTRATTAAAVNENAIMILGREKRFFGSAISIGCSTGLGVLVGCAICVVCAGSVVGVDCVVCVGCGSVVCGAGLIGCWLLLSISILYDVVRRGG